jgi:endoglucanase
MIRPKEEYIATSLNALNHFFGRNFYGRSFITGVGFNPPMYPHDRRSDGDLAVNPWPGDLMGDVRHGATEWIDIEPSYETNEIAINWNAALIYAMAGFVEP